MTARDRNESDEEMQSVSQDVKSKSSRRKVAKRESNIYVEVVHKNSLSQSVAAMTRYERLVFRTVSDLIRRLYKNL